MYSLFSPEEVNGQERTTKAGKATIIQKAQTILVTYIKLTTSVSFLTFGLIKTEGSDGAHISHHGSNQSGRRRYDNSSR